ncbi:MAG: hypothetical protein FWF08_03150 [Oscillospiraceae bacterium]|nr:hypothetical protein [Oscillospiraceae bacterium]
MYEMKDEQEKKFLLKNLLADNKAVFFISLLAAFSLWIWVSVYASPEAERIVANVKVNIDIDEKSIPAQMGLQIFGNKEFDANVTVTGPKYLISETALSAADIIIVPQYNTVTGPGGTRVQLTAALVNENRNIKLVSLSPATISLYFDTEKEAEFTIVPDIVPDIENIAEIGFISENPVLSASSVTVKGAASEVAKISKVSARVIVDEILGSTQSYPAELIPVDKNGNEVEYTDLELSVASVAVTIPIKKKMQLPATVDFINSPIKYLTEPLPFTVSPVTANIAVLPETAADLLDFSAGSVDFANIDSTVNTIKLPVSELKDITVLDDITEFAATIDARGMSKKLFNVSLENIDFLNKPDNVNVAPVAGEIKNVAAVGPEHSVSVLDAGGIYVEVDLADIDLISNAPIKVKANIYVKSVNDCWCFGQYMIEIKVE